MVDTEENVAAYRAAQAFGKETREIEAERRIKQDELNAKIQYHQLEEKK